MTVLAVTRMGEGRACLAGMSDQGEWLRPRPIGRLLQLSDLILPVGARVLPFDVIEMPVGRRLPNPPHVEDVEVDWRGVRIVDHAATEDRERLLSEWADHSHEEVFDASERSLGLVRAEGMLARMFPNGGTPAVKLTFCTQEHGRWCGLARVTAITDEQLLLGEFTRLEADRLKKNDLRRLYECREFYLAVGLTREFEGRYWPMVIGIHPVGGTLCGERVGGALRDDFDDCFYLAPDCMLADEHGAPGGDGQADPFDGAPAGSSIGAPRSPAVSRGFGSRLRRFLLRKPGHGKFHDRGG